MISYAKLKIIIKKKFYKIDVKMDIKLKILCRMSGEFLCRMSGEFLKYEWIHTEYTQE
jgi:hypothetical protein